MAANCESVRIIAQLNLNRKCDYVHSVHTLFLLAFLPHSSPRATRINLSSILGRGAPIRAALSRSPSIGSHFFLLPLPTASVCVCALLLSSFCFFSRYPLFLFPPRPCRANNASSSRTLNGYRSSRASFILVPASSLRSSSFSRTFTRFPPIESHSIAPQVAAGGEKSAGSKPDFAARKSRVFPLPSTRDTHSSYRANASSDLAI